MKTKKISTKYVKPVEYMSIRFMEKRTGQLYGSIRIQMWTPDGAKGGSLQFTPENYEEVYQAACVKLAEVLEYRRVPDTWINCRPTLQAVMDRCGVEVADGCFQLRETESIE